MLSTKHYCVQIRGQKVGGVSCSARSDFFFLVYFFTYGWAGIQLIQSTFMMICSLAYGD